MCDTRRPYWLYLNFKLQHLENDHAWGLCDLKTTVICSFSYTLWHQNVQHSLAFCFDKKNLSFRPFMAATKIVIKAGQCLNIVNLGLFWMLNYWNGGCQTQHIGKPYNNRHLKCKLISIQETDGLFNINIDMFECSINTCKLYADTGE